jgi:hypothetical protein
MTKYLVTLASVLLISTCSIAQFTSIQQNITNSFEFVEISEVNNTAIIGGVRVSKSTDSGITWTEMSLGGLGMPFTLYTYQEASIISPTVFCLIGKDNINQKGIIIRTNDGGATWVNVLETANGSTDYIEDIHYNGSVAIATSDGGIYRSADAGLSWTWISFVGTSDVTQVQYNQNTGIWLAERDYFNMHKSFDNGLTWTNQNVTFPGSGLVTQIENDGNNFLINKSQGAGFGGLVVMDNNYSFLDTITYTPFYTFSIAIEKAYFLPSNNVVASSYALFYNIDTTSGEFFYYDHNLVEAGGTNLVETRDFELGQTYGIAVGAFGGVSRFDMSLPADLYLPPTFSFNTVNCPGDTIIGAADFAYADSTLWYYDGAEVFNGVNLNYTTPTNVFGQHTIVMETWVDGNSKSSDTSYVNFSPLNSPPLFAFPGDTTICFDNNIYIPVDYLTGGVGSTSVSIWNDNQLVVSTTTGYNSLGFVANNVTDPDTLLLISTNQQLCGTTYDSISMIVSPTDDLSDDFNLLSFNNTICVDESPILPLSNIDSTYTYDITNSTGWFSSYTGSNNDSLTIIGPGTSYYFGMPSSSIATYSISISDTNGCSQGAFGLASVIIKNPKTEFISYAPSYYPNDTLNLILNQGSANPLWTVEVSSGLTVINPTNINPIIFGDTTGFFTITLTNEPIPNCIDSTSQIILYADTLSTDVIDTCWTKKVANIYKVHNTKFDSDGNIYTIASYRGFQWESKPVFQLTKRNPIGDIIWEKTGPVLNFYHKKAVLTDIDFDDNGDLYCLFTISGESTYLYELISFTDPGAFEYSRSYLVKIDGQTGDMISSQEISAMPEFSNYPNHNTYDIFVDGNLIYFTLAQSYSIIFCCVNTNGNYVSSYSFTGTLQPRINFLKLSGSNHTAQDCYVTPQFEKLANGDIAVLGYIGIWGGNAGQISYAGNYLYELGAAPESSILGAKYDPYSGLSDFKRLAKVPTGIDNFNFGTDQNSNITFATSWSNGLQYSAYIGDSLMPLERGSAVFQVNSNFDQNWLSIGNYSVFQEVDIAKSTGEIFVTGRANNNMALMTNGVSAMMGAYTPVINPYPGEYDFFQIRMNSSGMPLYGEFYDVGGLSSSYSYVPFIWQQSQSSVLVTPCGEVYSTINRMFDEVLTDTLFLENDGHEYMLDSSIIIKQSNNCSQGNCQFVCLSQDTLFYCENSNSIFVPTNGSFNVDSISYYLMANGIIIDSNTVTSNNQGFNVPVSSQNPSYEVAVYLPIIDTVFVVTIVATLPSYTFDSVICDGQSQVLVGNPVTNDFEWNSGLVSGNIYSINPLDYVMGLNEIDVSSTDLNGCTTLDTLEFLVNTPIVPTFAPSYYLNCNDQLIVAFNDSDYTSESWYVNFILTTNLFDQSNLVLGVNNVSVNLVDTNGCDINHQFVINYCSASIEEINTFKPIISPNPTSGNIVIDGKGLNDSVLFTVESSNGKLIESRAIDLSDSFSYDLIATPGTYFITIRNEKYVYRYKLIKL